MSGTVGAMQRVQVVDSHTGGEPTRVVIGGAPDLGGGTVAERGEFFRTQQDHFRSAVICEPRGTDVLVGALLVEPSDTSCSAGVIFFNNVGMLGMCGHGTIGLIRTLQHLGRIGPGMQRIETMVGIVEAELHDDGSVSVTNVPSYRKVANRTFKLEDGIMIHGDVVWAGNWFLLVDSPGIKVALNNLHELHAMASKMRQAANSQGFPEVDHVEIFEPSNQPGANSRNFVLCPGGAYDRSPCGTGTSAKLACLAADGKLAEGATWVQESIIGSRFRGSYRWEDRAEQRIIPTITGSAYVTAESTLLLDDKDPFIWGIRG